MFKSSESFISLGLGFILTNTFFCFLCLKFLIIRLVFLKWKYQQNFKSTSQNTSFRKDGIRNIETIKLKKEKSNEMKALGVYLSSNPLF